MKYQKPRVLLCWGYHRRGWLHAFNSLSNDFEFYYLFHLTKPDNEINFSGTANLLYWSDFKSAQQIISKIKPSKVVFMGIDSPNTIALNLVAKKKNIETLILQHGMFHKYSDYLRLAQEEMKERIKRGNFIRSEVEIDRFFLLKFFLRSVTLVAPLSILYFIKLQYLKRKDLEIVALKKARSRFRRPSKYIVFTKENATIYSERDGIPQRELTEIGNPEMDAYFNMSQTIKNSTESYYLLIDQPWSEVKDYSSPGYGISNEQTNEFYQKLAEFAESQSAQLKVKLHPYSYKSTFLVSHPNIEYLKDVDMVGLILQSEGVFGFNSTLTLPAIYFSKCCLFKIWEESSYQDDICQMKLAQVLDYHSFTPNDINLDSINKSEESMSRFVKKFFFKADGQSIARMKEILQENAI